VQARGLDIADIRSEDFPLPTLGFTETGRTRAPSWRNEVTLGSVEMFTENEPGAYSGSQKETRCRP
jgi:hypothetical protein